MKRSIVLFTLLFFSFHIRAQMDHRLSFRIGYSGSDGGLLVNTYDLSFSKRIFKKINLRLGYSQGNAAHSAQSEVLPVVFDEFINSSFIGDKDESGNPDTRFEHFSSLNLGISRTINTEGNLSLLFYIGARYHSINRMRFASSGTQLEFYKEQYYHEKKVAGEIEFDIEYQPVSQFSFGASVYYVNNINKIGGGLFIATYF